MSCAIRAAGVRYRYPGGHLALDALDLVVAHGERVALLGPNGAGKTTLLLHLNAILRGEGTLEVTGLRVGDGTVRELRARVGLVFQDPDDQLFMPTVQEDVAFGPLNLRLPREEVSRRVRAALCAVRMEEHATRSPHRLSMGQRRRVAIATVLSMAPHVLALDEPSANLDPRSRAELIDLLAGLHGTMVVATHDLPLAAELCERSVVLDRGRIVADGPTAELLADGGLLSAHDLAVPHGFDLTRIARRTAAWSGSPQAG